MSKANGQAAKMSFSGHALMENRNGQRLRRSRVSFLHFSPLKFIHGFLSLPRVPSLSRRCESSSSSSFGRKLLRDAHASISMPSTETSRGRIDDAMEELAGDVVLQQAFAILVNVVGSKLAANLSMSRNQRNSRL